MNKKKAGAAFIMPLCGLITQSFAQGQEIKSNSNADDIAQIGSVLEEFRQDIIHKDPYALTKLMLYPNVLFHSIDKQQSVDTLGNLTLSSMGLARAHSMDL